MAALVDGGVRFIVIGGVAANAHGSALITYDFDVLYDRSPDNIERLTRALAPFEPYLRGAPEGLPFALDPPTVRAGLNFTLTTTLGPLDLLGEAAGVGGYADIVDDSPQLDLLGRKVRVASLDDLLRMKRAAGRPKDLQAIAELELLKERA